jgi:MFS family permease
MDAESWVTRYLGELDQAAAALPPERRVELVGEVRGHIELALTAAGTTDEATVLAVLDRLGTPELIVAAETGATEPAHGVAPVVAATGNMVPRRLSTETRALLLLTVGSIVLPFIGPLLGLWIASGSERWNLTQKRTATLMVIVLLVIPALLLLPALLAGELTWIVTSGGFSLPLVPLAGFSAAIYLVGTSTLTVTVTRRG